MRLTAYQGIVCDLDGVVYRGARAIPYAVDALTRCGLRVIYATNNASRPPGEVAAHLRELGLPCRPEDVVTSSQAGAWLLARELDHGAPVLAMGGPGVAHALAEGGFEVVSPADAPSRQVAAVLQGYGRDVTASDLAEAAYAVAAGARWVATNLDTTLPTERGLAPGGGSLVQAVSLAVGRGPDLVAGKPRSPIYELALERLGVSASQALAIGDRLDTDIEGAVATGMDSLLVLTGVDDELTAQQAPEHQRPTFIAPDLRFLSRASMNVE